MTKTLPKLVLSASRDIPFSQLVLSQKNVRRVKAGLSIEDLAEDIYRRTLLQSINVRPLLHADGKETGMFEVPAGGRRFRALELLVKTKRMAKDQPVPCVVREAGIAEEDSLAENVMRVALHPLDQFRAFSALIEAGLSEEDIAARFFVSVSTVRQRLRLASVSPTLLEIYGEDGITLEQLILENPGATPKGLSFARLTTEWHAGMTGRRDFAVPQILRCPSAIAPLSGPPAQNRLPRSRALTGIPAFAALATASRSTASTALNTACRTVRVSKRRVT